MAGNAPNFGQFLIGNLPVNGSHGDHDINQRFVMVQFSGHNRFDLQEIQSVLLSASLPRFGKRKYHCVHEVLSGLTLTSRTASVRRIPDKNERPGTSDNE